MPSKSFREEEKKLRSSAHSCKTEERSNLLGFQHWVGGLLPGFLAYLVSDERLSGYVLNKGWDASSFKSSTIQRDSSPALAVVLYATLKATMVLAWLKMQPLGRRHVDRSRSQVLQMFHVLGAGSESCLPLPGLQQPLCAPQWCCTAWLQV